MGSAIQTTAGAETRGIATRLYLLAVFLMPLQFQVEQLESVLGARVAPADVVLAGALLAGPHVISFRRQAVSLIPLAFVAVLTYGVVLAIAVEGDITRHALTVKLFGGGVLAVWCLMTISHVRAGLLPTILRSWLSGMTFWAVVAYVDWRVIDVIPQLTHDLTTRFGGAQFDQNSAGMAYGVAAIVMWRYGGRLFSSPATRSLITVVMVTALALTLSRTAFVAVGGAVAVLLTVAKVGATTWIKYLAIGCLAFGIATASGLTDSVIDEFESRPDNVSGRRTLITEALDDYVESNGVGIGLGTQLAQRGEIVHSTPIQQLVETSLVGLAFVGAMVVVPIRAARRIRRVDSELGLALLGGHLVVVISSLGIDVLYQRPWWLLIGLCAGAGCDARGTASSISRDVPVVVT